MHSMYFLIFQILNKAKQSLFFADEQRIFKHLAYNGFPKLSTIYHGLCLYFTEL